MSTGLIVLIVFLVVVALAPFLTRAADLDERSRRGWWVNH
jgi:hypothetical protein